MLDHRLSLDTEPEWRTSIPPIIEPYITSLRHSSFSNPSVALPTSQLIFQTFFHYSYVNGSSLTSPVEPPIYLTSTKANVITSIYVLNFTINCSVWSSHKADKDRLMVYLGHTVCGGISNLEVESLLTLNVSWVPV